VRTGEVGGCAERDIKEGRKNPSHRNIKALKRINNKLISGGKKRGE